MSHADPVVQRRENGGRITLPPVGWKQRNRPLWAVLLMSVVPATFAAIGCAILAWAGPERNLVAILFMVVWTGFALTMLVLVLWTFVLPYFFMVRRTITVELHPDALTIHGAWLRTSKSRSWPTKSIRAITVNADGLYILDDRPPRPILAERDLVSLEQVAREICSTLSISHNWPLSEGEVNVQLHSSASQVPELTVGRLTYEGGQLILRHAVLNMVWLRIGPWPKTWWRRLLFGGRWPGPILHVDAEDLCWLPSEETKAALQIKMDWLEKDAQLVIRCPNGDALRALVGHAFPSLRTADQD